MFSSDTVAASYMLLHNACLDKITGTSIWCRVLRSTSLISSPRSVWASATVWYPFFCSSMSALHAAKMYSRLPASETPSERRPRLYPRELIKPMRALHRFLFKPKVPHFCGTVSGLSTLAVQRRRSVPRDRFDIICEHTFLSASFGNTLSSTWLRVVSHRVDTLLLKVFFASVAQAGTRPL